MLYMSAKFKREASKMTKTEAAEILANKTRVMGREWNMPLDKNLVEHVLSEARNWTGLFPAAVAANPSWRTVLHIAKKSGEL